MIQAPDPTSEFENEHFRHPKLRFQCFSSDGRFLLTGGYDGKARLWDIERGNLVKAFSSGTAFAGGIALSGTGKYLSVGGKKTRVFDADTQKQILNLPDTHPACITFAHRHPWLAYREKNDLVFWDLKQEKEISRRKKISYNDFSISEDDQHLYARYGGELSIFTAPGLEHITEIKVPLYVEEFSLSEHEKYLIVKTRGPEPAIHWFDTSSWECVAVIPAHKVVMAWKGSHLVFRTADWQYYRLGSEVPDFLQAQKLHIPEDNVPSPMSISRDGKLASFSPGFVWDLPRDQLYFAFNGYPQLMGRDGDLLFANREDQCLLYDLSNKKQVL